MAVTVRIIEYGTQNQVVLDAYQQDLFLSELRRVRGNWFTRFIALIFSFLLARTRPAKIKPDVQIFVEDGSSVTEYLVSSDTVLHQKGSRTNYQFYMGLMLQRWLSMPL
ncbi:MAG: hypothetical protein JJ850_06565 [Kordiimonadaceae bacterium]|nr:hypothetical protein [Kordiimonadaceae bacterium]MBO6568010.1 hypothetical protein [Kordiimonadaceae bacterium]MBO6964260.1 hypothetical protein [Kordiimonadaceae bacterium]